MLDTESLCLILSIETMSLREKVTLAWGYTAKPLQHSFFPSLLKNYVFVYLCIYDWLCWIFVAASRLSPVAAGGGCSLWCAVLSLQRLPGCTARILGLWAQQSQLTGSRAQAQQLWCRGLAVPQHVRSSQTRDQTHVPCTGRRLLTTGPPGKYLQCSLNNKHEIAGREDLPE